ncbi:MAG: SRPBCC family protein [Bacteroidetes bacterium]|nr:SRPBCC family protein [Bacteroidota bacterium]MBS1629649.1 SRPBCC family protein [Bacteroidota bacterium]
MKIIKRILLVVVIIIAIPFIVALFLPRNYSVSREIVIQRPRMEVFSFVRLLRNQEQYSVWSKLDPQMKQSFRGVDGQVGFVSAWDGNEKVGKGEQEITAIQDGERVDMDLRFEKPWKSEAKAHLSTADAGPGQTKVTWTFEGHSSWPMNFMTLFMNDMIGKDLQKGLENLKQTLEQSPTTTMH